MNRKQVTGMRTEKKRESEICFKMLGIGQAIRKGENYACCALSGAICFAVAIVLALRAAPTQGADVRPDVRHMQPQESRRKRRRRRRSSSSSRSKNMRRRRRRRRRCRSRSRRSRSRSKSRSRRSSKEEWQEHEDEE
jgi:hypothetical protein